MCIRDSTHTHTLSLSLSLSISACLPLSPLVCQSLCPSLSLSLTLPSPSLSPLGSSKCGITIRSGPFPPALNSRTIIVRSPARCLSRVPPPCWSSLSVRRPRQTLDFIRVEKDIQQVRQTLPSLTVSLLCGQLYFTRVNQTIHRFISALSLT